MQRSILIATLVVGFDTFHAYAAPATWDWYYDANITPGISGSVESPQGTPQSAFLPFISTPGGSVSSGVYSTSTLGTNGGAMWQYPTNHPLATLKSATGYTIEWRVGINSIDDADVAGTGSAYLSFEDGDTAVNKWFFLGFRNDGGQYQAVLSGGNLNLATIVNRNNSLNTYRVAVLGNTATLYMDNNPTPVGSVSDPRNDITGNVLEWGDGTGAGDSSYSVDYLYVSDDGAFPAVPEPTSISLLAAGALGLLRRSRHV